MEPAIPTGAVAFINTKDTAIEIGDIITYKMQSSNGGEVLVTHRVVDQEETGSYITKGDANDINDANPVSQEQIIGSYSYSIPKAGYLLAQLNKKVIIAIIVWIILLNGMSIALSSVFDKEETNNITEEVNNITENQDDFNTSSEEGVEKVAT